MAGDLLDEASLIGVLREHRPDGGLQPGRAVVRPDVVEPAGAHRRDHRPRRDPAARRHPDRRPGDPLLPGELVGDVRQGARGPPDARPRPSTPAAPTGWPRSTATGSRSTTGRATACTPRRGSSSTTSRPGGVSSSSPRKVTHGVARIAAGLRRQAAARQPRRPARLGLRRRLRAGHVADAPAGRARRLRRGDRRDPLGAGALRARLRRGRPRLGASTWSSTSGSCAPPRSTCSSATPPRPGASSAGSATVDFPELVADDGRSRPEPWSGSQHALSAPARWPWSASRITADPLGVLVAFGAGMLSFLSPCVLPLVPGYVSMVSGLSAAELETARDRSTASLRPLLRGIGLFVAGFTLVFTALGAAASGLGHLLGTDKQVLTTAAGAVVVVARRGARGRRPAGPVWTRAGSLVTAGAGRLVQRAAVPGPTLGASGSGPPRSWAWPSPSRGPRASDRSSAAVLGLAATRSTLAGGRRPAGRLLARPRRPLPGHRAGLRSADLALRRARRELWVVHLVAGAVLVAFGVLLVTDQLGWMVGRESRHAHARPSASAG